MQGHAFVNQAMKDTAKSQSCVYVFYIMHWYPLCSFNKNYDTFWHPFVVCSNKTPIHEQNKHFMVHFSIPDIICGHKHVYITPALTTPLNQHDESMMAQANWWLVVMMQMVHVYPHMQDFITLTFLVKLIYWNLYLLDVQLNWQTDIIHTVSHTSRIWWHH